MCGLWCSVRGICGMRRGVVGCLLLLPLLVSCGGGKVVMEHVFTVERINKYTPVKDQGRSQLCWIYAMLSTIETDRLSLGDSVHLSPFFPMRNYFLEQAGTYYNRQGRMPFTSRATALTAVRLLQQYGLMPYDAYRRGGNVNFTVLTERVEQLAQKALHTLADFGRYQKIMEEDIDKSLGQVTGRVFMYGAEYTPHEFARSVCAPGEYEGYTSFTHHAFYDGFALEVPDNHDDCEYYNLPLQELVDNVCEAVRRGYAVCWEGDISEPGFSFKQGVAVLPDGSGDEDMQELRQLGFEDLSTTDDHCMSIIGLAHDEHGKPYFILKNSWGTDNPYGGLMYMSQDYFKLKTIAVVMSKASLQSTDHRHRPDREQYIYLR